MSEKIFPSSEEIVKQYPALKEIELNLLEVDVSQLGLQREYEKAKKKELPSVIAIALDTSTLINALRSISDRLFDLLQKGKITKEEYEKLREIFDIRKATRFIRDVAEEAEASLKQKVKELVG